MLTQRRRALSSPSAAWLLAQFQRAINGEPKMSWAHLLYEMLGLWMTQSLLLIYGLVYVNEHLDVKTFSSAPATLPTCGFGPPNFVTSLKLWYPFHSIVYLPMFRWHRKHRETNLQHHIIDKDLTCFLYQLWSIGVVAGSNITAIRLLISIKVLK